MTTASPTRPKRSAARALPSASISEFDGVRYLHLGETPWVQGAMRLRKHRALELEYVQRMMVWLLLCEPAALAAASPRVVQLGLGAAALTRFCHTELGLATTTVELNPQVIAACRQWFRLPANDERLNVVEADAGIWVADEANHGSADVLCIDLYDHQAAAPVLDDEAFYRDCHAVLAEGGVLVVNLFGRNASFTRSARRIEAAFAPGGGQVLMLTPTEEGNTIVVALKNGPRPDDAVLRARADWVAERCKLKAVRWLGLLGPLPPARRKPGTTAAAPDPGSPT
ncbi:spermidine synthase [Sphaerotilus sp.]|uniref:spermine/spermidine synthase domain-containing protein n=1 Tax=Sphaerotilus sp. TaxID=2093942 RepID=UPI002ACE2C19|nr:spermidine synthase [Sphaerotilus sp.]MDZ7855510.1 spermidine synthase [Sphaerotilus sp.]